MAIVKRKKKDGIKKSSGRGGNVKAASNAKVITGVCRSSYMFCTKLELDEKSGDKKCRSMLIIRKKDTKTVKAIKAAIQFAAEKKFGKDVNTKGRNFGYGLRDADDEMDNGDIVMNKDLKGCYFVNASAYKLPGLVDQYNSRVEDSEDREQLLVSGFYFRFSIEFRGYDTDGNKGVRCVLNNLMFVKEGDRMDGGSDADEDFEGFGEEQDDDDDED